MMNTLEDIDWNEVWKSRTKETASRAPAWTVPHLGEPGERAALLEYVSDEFHRTQMVIKGTNITADSRVLDIGAGHPGHPICRQGGPCHVSRAGGGHVQRS